MGALALVFALFFGGIWVWRNWQRLIVRHGPAPKLAVLEGKSLGQRHTIYVIGYEQQRMLVAASPTGVTMLSALPAAEPHAPEAAAVEASRPPAPAFGALLLRAIAQRS
jgi:flagellar biogenesis protein FliO